MGLNLLLEWKWAAMRNAGRLHVDKHAAAGEKLVEGDFDVIGNLVRV